MSVPLRMSNLHLPASTLDYGPYGVAVCMATALIVLIKMSHSSKLDAIPTVGSSGWLDSWWAGLKFFTKSLYVVQDGYEKHKPTPFKVAQIYRWLVVLNSREHVEELRRAPEDVLSLPGALNERFQTEHTMGHEVYHNPYHVSIVRGPLTRSIGILYPEMKNEVTTAIDDILDVRGNEWKSVPAISSIQQVVCRASNRIFVGLPLCRDHEWIDLNINFTLDVVKGGIVIGMFPRFLKPIIARFCTNIHQSKLRAQRLLGPIIEERQRCLKEWGSKWADKPNDLLSWLMDAAEGPESTVECLTTRVLVVNFASIHTTSRSFSHALFYLAANPQYIQPLREEVESIVEKEGWSKASLGKMRKIDSFLKECQRLAGINGLSMHRLALKDFTFADGMFIPKGTAIAVASKSIHRDEAFYKNADAFEPFRFADLGDNDGESTRYDLTSTTPEYLPFGHGRIACPGRFFAATVLKTMLAHIVVTYDVKLPDNIARPETLYFAGSAVPDPNAKAMFRRRFGE